MNRPPLNNVMLTPKGRKRFLEKAVNNIGQPLKNEVLAELATITVKTVSRIKNGQEGCQQDKIRSLFRAIGLELETDDVQMAVTDRVHKTQQTTYVNPLVSRLRSETKEETTMTLVSKLADEIATTLIPHLPLLVQSSEPALPNDPGWQVARRLFQLLMERWQHQPDLIHVVHYLADVPQDTGATATLQHRMRELLAKTPDLAAEINALLHGENKDAVRSSQGKYRVTVTDSKGVQVGDNNEQHNTFN